jgi:hypothetical protein
VHAQGLCTQAADSLQVLRNMRLLPSLVASCGSAHGTAELASARRLHRPTAADLMLPPSIIRDTCALAQPVQQVSQQGACLGRRMPPLPARRAP